MPLATKPHTSLPDQVSVLVTQSHPTSLVLPHPTLGMYAGWGLKPVPAQGAVSELDRMWRVSTDVIVDVGVRRSASWVGITELGWGSRS